MFHNCQSYLGDAIACNYLDTRGNLFLEFGNMGPQNSSAAYDAGCL